MKIMENLKFEVRANVKFLSKLGWSKSDTFKSIKQVYGDNCPTRQTIYSWYHQFVHGRESIQDDHRDGRPSTANNEENVSAIREMIEHDRRLTVRIIAETLGISLGAVHSILKEQLGLSKICARWVPRALRAEHKEQRLDCSLHLLNKFDNDPEDFLARCLTGDETWLYQYDPESKLQSKQWLPTGHKGPIKFRVERSAAKVMATIFWDADGLVLIDFLEHGRTITGDYYQGVLHKLKQALIEKRPGKLHRGILFHDDNAPAHRSQVCRSLIRDFRWETLPHPPYSPDLAPSDFFLFPNLKKNIKGKRWASISDLKSATIDWLEHQDKSFFRSGLEGWRSRMDKCMMLQGDYVEK